MSPIELPYSLRFRDYQADTIQEHTKIIESHGSVWWGWFKKDSEPSRTDDLSLIKSRLGQGRVNLGLFDRSQGRYFIVEVSACEFVGGEEKMAAPDRSLTPEYYRDKELPAWFSITQFRPLPEEEFRDWFGIIPVTDHTFHLSAEEEVAAKRMEKEAQQPHLIPSNVIVHISDLHFGIDHGYPLREQVGKRPMLEILAEDIKKEVPGGVGVLVVSGDLTSRADANEFFSSASPRLSRFCAELGIETSRVVIVPGNHDIAIKDYTHEDFSHERAFKAFLRDFYGEEREIHGLERFETPGSQTIEMLLMNSVKLRKPETSNFGYVGWRAYEPLLERSRTHSRLIRMAILHHHLLPTVKEENIDPEYPVASFSLTLDAGAIIEGLQRFGFGLALHGHQHCPGISRIGRARMEAGATQPEGLESPLNVMAAGSAGARRKRLPPEVTENFYSLLEFQHEKVNVKIKGFNVGGGIRQHCVAELDMPSF
jgi:hypothetical protein